MFLSVFTKKFPKVKLSIEELTTEEIIKKLVDGHLDAAIAATPLENKMLKELPLYYEPFVGFVPDNHPLSSKTTLEPEDLDVDTMLLLEDGHCFKENILNICKIE